MPTPKKGYRNAAGKIIPGTTSIIGRFKESGGLMYWAHQQGLEGLPLYEKAEQAANVGSVVHAMVEADGMKDGPAEVLEYYVNRGELNADQIDAANSAFNAYRAWTKNFKLVIVEQEIQLVDETLQYGGTPDAVGWVGDVLCLLDWKTSNGVYVDMLVQLAAYRNLWNVNRPDKPLTGGSHLLRFAKEHGDFAHHYYPNLDEAFEQFKLFRRAYDIDKGLKKRAA